MPESSRSADERPPGSVGEPSEPGDAVAGMLRASDLPGGRRRRRTALEAGQEIGPECGPEFGSERDELPRAEPARRTRRPKAEESADPAQRARDICLRLLTGASKTRKQLADALHRREIPDEVAEEVLSRFEEVGLIDDAAFAAAWVESRHAVRGLSRRALAQELRTRGVTGEAAEQALVQVDADDEADAARALVERKLRATRGVEPRARTRRLVAMLARRGYAEGLAYRVVREALRAEGADVEDDW